MRQGCTGSPHDADAMREVPVRRGGVGRRRSEAEW
jgi:hypothetical protein